MICGDVSVSLICLTLNLNQSQSQSYSHSHSQSLASVLLVCLVVLNLLSAWSLICGLCRRQHGNAAAFLTEEGHFLLPGRRLLAKQSLANEF